MNNLELFGTDYLERSLRQARVDDIATMIGAKSILPGLTSTLKKSPEVKKAAKILPIEKNVAAPESSLVEARKKAAKTKKKSKKAKAPKAPKKPSDKQKGVSKSVAPLDPEKANKALEDLAQVRTSNTVDTLVGNALSVKSIKKQDSGVVIEAGSFTIVLNVIDKLLVRDVALLKINKVLVQQQTWSVSVRDSTVVFASVDFPGTRIAIAIDKFLKKTA